MIITQKTPTVLFTLMNIYKESNESGKAYATLRDCIYHNNEPVNIVKAITAMKDVQCMINLNKCHPVEMEYCLRYFSEVTGYSSIELNERLSI